jgi:hypothetical protein
MKIRDWNKKTKVKLTVQTKLCICQNTKRKTNYQEFLLNFVQNERKGKTNKQTEKKKVRHIYQSRIAPPKHRHTGTSQSTFYTKTNYKFFFCCWEKREWLLGMERKEGGWFFFLVKWFVVKYFFFFIDNCWNGVMQGNRGGRSDTIINTQ